MPIEYRIDHDRSLVWTRGHGTLTDQDIFKYQREVWSRPDVMGYSELMDMSAVEQIEVPSTGRVWELAQLSVRADDPRRSAKFAIFAPSDLAFGMGRMYENYRGLQSGSTKEVGVFRTREEALAFLGIKVSARDQVFQ
jgi:hypothetical protein